MGKFKTKEEEIKELESHIEIDQVFYDNCEKNPTDTVQFHKAQGRMGKKLELMKAKLADLIRPPVEYPDSHHNAEKMKPLKEKIDKANIELVKNREEAREHYIAASKNTTRIYDLMVEIAVDLNKVEALIVEPSI